MKDLNQLNEMLKQSFGKIRDDIEQLNVQLALVKRENKELKEEIQKLKTTPQMHPPLAKEALYKIHKNKKNIIKQKIVELIEARKFSLPEIKEIIVDKHNYCSKASFYRYMEQLKMKTGEIQTDEKTIIIPQEM